MPLFTTPWRGPLAWPLGVAAWLGRRWLPCLPCLSLPKALQAAHLAFGPSFTHFLRVLAQAHRRPNLPEQRKAARWPRGADGTR